MPAPLTRTEQALALTIDDIEKRRTHAVRTLADNRDLLADALHAVQHGRLLVTAEFIDRVLTAVDAELKYQRGE